MYNICIYYFYIYKTTNGIFNNITGNYWFLTIFQQSWKFLFGRKSKSAVTRIERNSLEFMRSLILIILRIISTVSLFSISYFYFYFLLNYVINYYFIILKGNGIFIYYKYIVIQLVHTPVTLCSSAGFVTLRSPLLRCYLTRRNGFARSSYHCCHGSDSLLNINTSILIFIVITDSL